MTCESETVNVIVNKTIKTLALGKYDLQVLFDGKELNCNFTIKDTTSPKTGDNLILSIYAFLILLSGCAVGTVTFRRRDKERVSWEKLLRKGDNCGKIQSVGRRTVMEEKNSFEKIYDVVRQIPKGRVASYGQVARLAGNSRWSRVVGYALHVNPEEGEIPCHRVVTKDGGVSEAFAFGGKNRQIELLRAEGVKFIDDKVDMKTYQWKKIIF